MLSEKLLETPRPVKVSFVEIWFLVQSCALPGCASCDVAKVAPGTVEVDTTKTVRDEIATYCKLQSHL